MSTTSLTSIRLLDELESQLRNNRDTEAVNGLVSLAGTHFPTPTSADSTVPLDDENRHSPPTKKPEGWVFQATFTRTSKIIERKPPLDLVVLSISVFFRHIHPWFPFLDTQRVLTELGSMRDPSLSQYAIFGASLPFLHDSRLDQTMSDSFWKYTKRRIFVEAAEEPSYASLEASTILTLDPSGMTNGPQTWGRLAVITKLAPLLRTLGGRVLRPSVQPDSQNTQISQPTSRQHARLFWAIYALDSFVSLTTNQPPALTAYNLDDFLATRDMAWDDASHGQPGNRLASASTPIFLEQLKLLDIARQAHGVYLEYITLTQDDTIRSSRWLRLLTDCYCALDVWSQKLPSSLHTPGANQENNNQRLDHPHPAVVMLNGYSHALTIYLYGLVEFSSHPTLSPQLSEFRTAAHQRCVKSVEAITNISSRFVDSLGDQIGWPFSWSMWTAARYLLVAAYYQGSTVLLVYFHSLLESLKKMGKFWQISKKYWRLLCRAEDALKNRSATGDSENAEPTILTSLVDLRVPTSDLEDQFRVDPVLSNRSGSLSRGVPDTLSNENSAMASAHGTEATVALIPDEPVFVAGGYPSDTWFTTPLFASSAYQQFPDDSHDSEAWPFTP